MTALDLFSRKGYEGTSVRELCEAAGITKPTLYHFYKSKEGVYRALVDGALQEYRQTLVRQLGTPGSARERLRRVARWHFAYSLLNRGLMRFILSLVHNPTGAAPALEFNRFYEDVVRRIAGAVEAGVAAGELRPGPLQPRMLVFMGALGEAMCGQLILGRPELDDRLADEIVDTVLDGWSAARA
ncbi:MAG: TetR/AcrR family transcriptional regulator [Vicinamibacteria bacterium]